MKFDFIISNPPFDCGANIINALILYSLKANPNIDWEYIEMEYR